MNPSASCIGRIELSTTLALNVNKMKVFIEQDSGHFNIKQYFLNNAKHEMETVDLDVAAELDIWGIAEEGTKKVRAIAIKTEGEIQFFALEAVLLYFAKNGCRGKVIRTWDKDDASEVFILNQGTLRHKCYDMLEPYQLLLRDDDMSLDGCYRVTDSGVVTLHKSLKQY